MKAIITTLIVLSVLMLGLQFFQDALVFKRIEITNGQWWRIITGNFVHTNYPHLALNLTGLWILGFLFSDTFNSKKIILSTLFMSVFTGLFLYWFSTNLGWYAGFSGVLYGLFLVGSVTAIYQKDYLFGFGVAILIVGKVIWGHFMGGSESSAELIGVPVATDAHLFGITGAIFVSAYLGIQHFFKNAHD
jgi:rhomboid family GlyGly-CTERM serine protease